MIDTNFKQIMLSGKGCAVIMAGSDSDDKPKSEGEVSHVCQISDSLKKFGIPFQVRICSAHKQPGELQEIIDEYNEVGGSVTFVAVAGGTDALSGTLSFHALGPVISCPPDAPNYSCLTNPPGSSNAYIARPANVGKIVAQIYAGVNNICKKKLQEANQKKIEKLREKDGEIKTKYSEIQGNIVVNDISTNSNKDFLTSEQARSLIKQYMEKEKSEESLSTQEILDSGAIPELKGYIVRPGKVSDSIFGGRGSFLDKKTGQVIEFENPLLQAKDGTPLRIMVRTERISTHDINRGCIPFKDQILALNHNYMRKMLKNIIGTSQLEVSRLADNSVVIAAENLEQLGFENVLRAYMAKSSTSTSLYQHYLNGEREFCAHKLPENLATNGILPYIMDTPSTKSDEHDESVSPEFLFTREICTPEQYNQIKNGSIMAFGIVSQFLRDKGLIAVDTKTEHGINSKGEIVAQDEIWTMDSSRFWLLEDYSKQLGKFKSEEITELNPKSYSKEFARGFSEGDKDYTDEQREEIAVRYIEGIQHLLGKKFEPDMRSRKERVVDGLKIVVDEVVA